MKITASPSNETTIADSTLTIEEIAKYQDQRNERFINFEKCVITGKVSELKLQKARFIDCDIQVSIDKCDLDKLYFFNCAISSTEINGGHIKEIGIDKSTLKGNRFNHIQMEAISIEESNLHSVSCSHCPSMCHIRVFESKLFSVNIEFINQFKHIAFCQNIVDNCSVNAILKIENFRITENKFTDFCFVPLKLYFFHSIVLRRSRINKKSPMAKVNSGNAEGVIVNNIILHSRIEFAAFINTSINGNIFVDDSIIKCSFLQTRTFNNNTFSETKLQSLISERSAQINSGLEQKCPEEGSFIAFKKVFYKKNESTPMGLYTPIFSQPKDCPCIAKLLIPEDAMRSSALSSKCRASKAKVLGFYDLNGNELNINEAYSSFDAHFKYKADEIVEVKNFDTNRWNECTTGIHFFLSFSTAANYNL